MAASKAAVSRILYRTFSYGGGHLSMRPEPGIPSTASSGSSPIWSCCGWGLPCGPAFAGTRRALTPPFHPYRSPKGTAVCFLWHWPSCGIWSAVSSHYRRTSRSVQSGLSSVRKTGPRSPAAFDTFSSIYARKGFIQAENGFFPYFYAKTGRGEPFLFFPTNFFSRQVAFSLPPRYITQK